MRKSLSFYLRAGVACAFIYPALAISFLAGTIGTVVFIFWLYHNTELVWWQLGLAVPVWLLGIGIVVWILMGIAKIIMPPDKSTSFAEKPPAPTRRA